jgi:ferredoxin
MLAINPDECIDCGVCEPACPAEAIQPGSDANLTWQELNREMAQIWPNLTIKQEPLPNAEEAKHEHNKIQYLSKNPGSGNS